MSFFENSIIYTETRKCECREMEYNYIKWVVRHDISSCDIFALILKCLCINASGINHIPSFHTRYEPPHGKTNNLHMQKQRRRSASR